MRLLRQIQRAEASAAAAAREPEGRVSLCWSCYETRVDPAELRCGEYIAVDLAFVGEIGGVAQNVLRERVTLDGSDLGSVFGPGDVCVGRVVAIDGTLITYELDAEAAAG